MLIQPHIEPHIVDDYDILLQNGLVMPVSVDKTAGDTIDFDSNPLVVRIYLAPKPSLHDPSKKLSAEDITIYAKHIVSVTHRTREVIPPTPEQQYDLKELLHKLPSSIQ